LRLSFQLSFLRPLNVHLSILTSLFALFLIVLYLVLNFSILFKQKNKHLIQLLILLNLHLQHRLHPLNLLPDLLQNLHLLCLEVLWVLLDEFLRTLEVFDEFVVECLA
jgi:hypothetical protein